VIPVFGGYVADSMAGKYNTILGSGLIYTLGRLERFLCSIGYCTMILNFHCLTIASVNRVYLFNYTMIVSFVYAVMTLIRQ